MEKAPQLVLQAQEREHSSCVGDERTLDEVSRNCAFMGFTTCQHGVAQGLQILLRFVSDEAAFDIGQVRPPAVSQPPATARPPRRPPFKRQAAVILLRKAHR